MVTRVMTQGACLQMKTPNRNLEIISGISGISGINGGTHANENPAENAEKTAENRISEGVSEDIHAHSNATNATKLSLMSDIS